MEVPKIVINNNEKSDAEKVESLLKILYDLKYFYKYVLFF